MPATSRTKRFIRGSGRSCSNKAFRRRLSRPPVGEAAVGSSLSGPIAAGSSVAAGASGEALPQACARFFGHLVGRAAFGSRRFATGPLRASLLL